MTRQRATFRIDYTITKMSNRKMESELIGVTNARITKTKTEYRGCSEAPR